MNSATLEDKDGTPLCAVQVREVREPQIPPGYRLTDDAINYLAAMANAHNRRERRMLQARFRQGGHATFERDVV